MTDADDSMFEGHLDRIDQGIVFGWAWRMDLPDDPIAVDLLIDRQHEGSAVANWFRTDLKAARKGNGRHAFEMAVPDRYRDGRSHVLQIRYRGTTIDLTGSPASISFEAAGQDIPPPYEADRRAWLDGAIRRRDQERHSAGPRVSVIVPCFNLGVYVDEAVDSVLEQTFEDVEILIVNDGSTDRYTNELLAAYRRPRVTVMTIENQGPAAARNAGIRVARGVYLCALDADDKLDPTYLAKAVKVLDAEESLAFVSCWLRTFGEEDVLWKQDRCDLPTLLGECTVATPALVRRDAVLAVGGFDEDRAQWGNEDWLLWIALVERGFRGTILPEVLFYYRKTPGSLSAFWMNGEAHLQKLRRIVTAHSDSYRRHLIDVLLRKEADICDLLRENDAAERHIHWLRTQIQSWRNETERLTAKLAQAGR